MRSRAVLGRLSEQPKSPLAEVLLRYGYKQILHEEMSGVSSDLYVRACQGVHRAQISHNGNQVSVLMPGHYEVYKDPIALEGALWAMFGPLEN
ncbi:MAG TPA: hypothetical protein VEG30_05515 [Terriglobales bacterium]|nr:hypothetical protein [Terriglobales bacterium]